MELDIQAKKQLQQRFTIVSLLGKGSFGHVYECIDRKDNECYAVKVISKSNVKKSKLQCLREQAKILLTLKHPNIVKVHEFVETDICVFLRMELVRGGNLDTFIKHRFEKGEKISQEEAAKIMGEIFKGVDHIHSVSIIHRDLKPQNILMKSQQTLESLKIADFGLSTKLDFYYPKTATMKCGTMLYMAPQILNNYTYNKSVDVWACSVIMYMLFEGKHPIFHGKMATDDYKQKIKTTSFPRLRNNKLLDFPFKLAQDFLDRISKIQPDQRYCTQQALKHPWLTRNFEDQIPLSLYQSYAGFQKSHEIAHMIRISLIVKSMLKSENNVIPKDYLAKKEMFNIESCTNLKKNRSRKNGNNIQSLNSIQSMFQKKQQNKQRKHKRSAELEAQSPTIMKLNRLFNSLFDRKAKNKIHTQGFEMHPMQRDHMIEMPCIDDYKSRIQAAIEKAVAEYKSTSQVKKKKILRSRKNSTKIKEQYFGSKQEGNRSSSQYSSTSSNKVRYRKRQGAALKYYQ